MLLVNISTFLFRITAVGHSCRFDWLSILWWVTDRTFDPTKGWTAYHMAQGSMRREISDGPVSKWTVLSTVS